MSEAKRPRPWTPPAGVVLFLLCVIVALLNVFDALATFEIVRRGGEEANPLAKPMFERGEIPFFLWKTAVTVVSAALLALGARRYRFAWWALLAGAAFYAAIAFLHAYLLFFVTRPP